MATSPLLYGTQGLPAVSLASSAPRDESCQRVCICARAALASGVSSPLTHAPSFSSA